MTAPPVALPQPLSRERRVDWARVLLDLRNAGMSLHDVAEWLGVGKSTLRGYVNEDLASEPAYWTGHCLIVLWRFRCGGQLDAVPLRAAPLSVSRMLSSTRCASAGQHRRCRHKPVVRLLEAFGQRDPVPD